MAIAPMLEKKIEVRKPAPGEVEKQKMKSWSTWSCDVSEFDWTYDDRETCLILEGKVTVQTADGGKVQFGPGDVVIFPRGLSCTWKVTEPVKKHYKFG